MVDTTRHNAYLKNVPLTTKIHIIGCGSIGSSLAATLTRLGFTNFTLWDTDTIEPHNIANQHFDSTDLHKPKNWALAKKLLMIEPKTTITLKKKWTDTTKVRTGDHIMVCVDNMQTRQHIYHNRPKKDSIIIDGRMGGLEAHVYAFRTNTVYCNSAYHLTLYSEDTASQLPCTERTIIYTINITTSIMAKAFLDILTHKTESVSYLIDMHNPAIHNIHSAPQPEGTHTPPQTPGGRENNTEVENT